jgi:chorismate lyase/3-hydroxybenzoate synthase
MGYPHLLRIWNYFPGINSLVDGLERYQHFCVGRYQALAERFSSFPHALPAGTAIGTKEGPFQLYFLAAVQPGIPIENPRQISAYHYPPDYGPRSPSFARATVQRSEFDSQLFISGTASVVGHATQHAEHPAEQAAETIANLRALMDQVEIVCGRKIEQRMGTYKLYVRHAQDVDRIRNTLRRELSAGTAQLWLQGNLCRRDLLLEIEAVVPLC